MTESLVPNGNHVVVVPANRDKKYELQDDEHVHEPPDGGFRAYLVMICAFLCNGILFGIINTYSVIFMSLQKQLELNGEEGSSSKACKLANKKKASEYEL